jgi:hypothetical protein
VPEIGALVEKVRSKNAGPFWLTIDIFCGSTAAYAQVVEGLSTARLAALFQSDVTAIKRFDIADLNVVKFSLPRPVIQGTAADRDMHGAAWGPLVAEIEIN